jgi:hypothetical protein
MMAITATITFNKHYTRVKTFQFSSYFFSALMLSLLNRKNRTLEGKFKANKEMSVTNGNNNTKNTNISQYQYLLYQLFIHLRIHNATVINLTYLL